MSTYFISINQIAAFSNATNASKKRIIKQQIDPNKFLIPWYQSAKGSLKKYFADVSDLAPLKKGIDYLEKKEAKNKRQILDKKVSIEALKKMEELPLPKLLSKINYKLIKLENKSLTLNNVIIKIAPDVIIKGTLNGKTVYGAIKFHICKTKPFALNQAQYVSALLYRFLSKNFPTKDVKILPELCLCLDIFAERIVPAPENSTKEIKQLKDLCTEVKNLWTA